MTVALHCVYCSARLPDNALLCSGCHSPVPRIRCFACQRESVAGTAQCVCGARLDSPIPEFAPCPRCKTIPSKLARRTITQDCFTLECRICGGVMIDPRSWSAMMDDLAAGSEAPYAGIGEWNGKPLPLAEMIAMLACPGCRREMDRMAFAGRSKVSLDACTLHGLWFDGGELAKVLAIVRYQNAHGGELPPPSGQDVNQLLTTQERRAKVLESMGIPDPENAQIRRAPIKIRDHFDANRVAGRIAFVAGGLEGVAAYGVLRAVAHGGAKAFEWALDRSRPDPTDDVPIARSGRELPRLRCLYCGAAHKESDTQCGVCLSPIARITCTACGARIAAGENACICGAPLLPPASSHEMACPRCRSALEKSVLDENTVAFRCPRCLGSFFDIQDWTVVIDRTVVGKPLPVASFVPLPPGRELPSAKLMEGAACPRCRKPMERITFATRSRVVVDVCANHGMWLDAGELVALCAFMKPAAVSRAQDQLYEEEETRQMPSRPPRSR